MKYFFLKICIVASICSISLLQGCKSSQSDVAPAAAANSGTRPAAAGESVSTSGAFYSSWISPASWGARTNAANYVNYRYSTPNIPRLDQAMLDQGAILVYARFGGVSGETFPVPFQRIWSRTNSGVGLAYEKWGFQATLNQITVTIDPEINGYNPPTDVQLRYVLITGDAATGRKAHVDYSNYEEVKAAYNLVD